MRSAIFRCSVDQAPAPEERPVDDEAAAHDILLGHGAEVAAVAAIEAVVSEGEVGAARHGVIFVGGSENGKAAAAGAGVLVAGVTIAGGHDALQHRDARDLAVDIKIRRADAEGLSAGGG